MFKQITDNGIWQQFLDKVENLPVFFLLDWEREMMIFLPGVEFRHYIYQDNFLVSLGVLKGHFYGLPGIDTGAVVPLSNQKLDLDVFDKEAKIFFGNNFKISVNEFWCSTISINNSTELADYVLDLHKQTKDGLYNGFRKTLRYEINKNKDKIIIKKINTSDLKSVYKLYLKNLRKKKNLVISWRLFLFLYNLSNSSFWGAYKEGDLIAFAVFIEYDDRIHYYLSATSFEGKKCGAAHILLWKELEEALKKNVHWFSFGGTRVGTNLEIFKRGWGSVPYNIYELRNTKKDFQGLRKSKFRNLWSFLPLRLLPLVSRYFWKKLF